MGGGKHLHAGQVRVPVKAHRTYCNVRVQVRKAQIGTGDREVYVNEQGERMSRLREVNSDWIIRRLERWGKQVRHVEPHSFQLLSCLINRICKLAALLGALTDEGGTDTRAARISSSALKHVMLPPLLSI